MSSPALPPPPPPGAPAVPPPPTSPAATAATAVPTLPPPPTVPVSAPAPPTPDPLSLTPPATTPDTPSPRNSRATLLVALIAAVALFGGAAFWLTSGNEAEPESVSTDGPVAPSDPIPPTGGDSIGQIGVEAFDDAQTSVDAINDNESATELLAELGLGPTGEPIAEAQPAKGHQFTWTFIDGTSATVTVDLVTGDNSYSDDTGLSIIESDGRTFARSTGQDAWVEVDAGQVAGFERLGLTGPVTTDDLIGGTVAPFATPNADGAVWSVDDVAFDQADAASRGAWIERLGLPFGPATGSIEFTLDVAADGITVSSATIVMTATGETVGYRLDRLFDVAPVIDAPLP